jgi:hypothetical protein
LRGTSDNNIAFAELRYALATLGFEVRVKGDHFIYTKQGIAEIVNLQPLRGMAKAYQVKQVRTLILKYKLASELGAASRAPRYAGNSHQNAKGLPCAVCRQACPC